MSKFTHLHLHTEYSLLDGTIKIPALVEKLKESGMDACAITDHGVMYGAFKFYKAMKNNDIKPIIGCEMYVAPRSIDQKEAGIDNKMKHLLLIAKNLKGYQNLMKLNSIAHLEGFYYRPRVDLDLLKMYSEGLIVTSACMGGVLGKEILNGNIKKAEENAEIYKEIFNDDFYIEIQRNGLEEQEEVNDHLLKISDKLNIPIVATSDVHYLEQEDAMIQEVLWCIADGKTLDDPTRRQMGSDQFYLKSSKEMEELFADLPEAIENTRKIKESVEDFDITFGRVEPIFAELEDYNDPKDMLRDLSFEGAKIKYGELTDDLKERIEFELKIIDDKGYNDYFLITRQFVKFCRENGIVVGMRGSGCGSVVAYCTDITNLEPISWELYFERFLNPERDSPPDFDVDIADHRRDEVINYAIETFGEDSVRQIGTFSKLQTKQAIRDVSRVLGIDLGVADQLSKMVVVLFGKVKDIDYMLENDKEFAEQINSSPELQRMSNIVRKISGLCRGVSTHACGVVITPEPVSNYVPLQRDSKNEGIGMTQFEMFDLEEVGVMKFDFLGLRNLAVIGDAVEKIKFSRGIEIDLLTLDPNDEETFKLIQSGNTIGIFQMESEGMRKSIRSLKPNSQEEICYLLAAYRPGPMQFIPEYVDVKEGKKEAEYLFPELEPILSITNGVITYQEQVIRIAVDIAGYSMGSADILRKAMGKKKLDIMEKEKPKFIEGAVANGFERGKVEQLWDKLLKFADYGFNKAHSASYALVSYWTAYLKAHYPMEFMAALLESDLDDFDRVVIDLQECDRLGIQVLPPDINKSFHRFAIEDETNIRFGLAAIKNVGEDVVMHIVNEREKNGEYLNFDDFIYRNVNNKLQKRTVEYLIQAGVFDNIGDRNQLLEVLPNLYDSYRQQIKDREKGQFDLFSGTEVQINITEPTKLPEIEKSTVSVRLEWEKELLGVYLTSHPLDDLQEFLQSKKAISIRNVLEMDPSRKLLVIGGIISEIKRITTKNGDNMAFLTVEDKTGSIDMVVFPGVYEDIKDELQPSRALLFAGRLNERDGEKSFILAKGKVIDPDKHGSNFEGITFYVDNDNSVSEINELKKFIAENPGQTEVRILISDEDGEEKSIMLKNGVKLGQDTDKYLKKFSSEG